MNGEVFYANYSPEERAKDIITIGKYLNAWTNQMRGFACNDAGRVKALIAAQPDAAFAERLTAVWEDMKCASTNRAPDFTFYAYTFAQGLKSSDDPHSRLLARHFFTMLVCLPDLSFPPPSGLDSPNWACPVEGVWNRLGLVMASARPLLETAETFLEIAGFMGDVRMNMIPDLGDFGRGSYTGEKDALFHLRNWCCALRSCQRSLRYPCEQWSWSMIDEIRRFAAKMPPDERKRFLDQIKKLARSDEEEAKRLDEPIPVKRP
ncbi:MAG: hypothetical protein FWG50_11030 [Kiritimatiellaeota bacterium]|nr:hypothetical protein [Kiritimatiellota bacterium]